MRTPPNERLTPDILEAANSRTSGSERRCVLTGDNGERARLLRLAISPDGLVLPDAAAKAPGRGAWVGVGRSALEAAVADGSLKRALLRAFKGAKLAIPDDLAARALAALTRNFTDRLGLELRSGQIVLGSARIAEQARSGRIALLLHASDSSEDGRRKLDQAWRVGSDAEGSGMQGTTLPLDRAALSVALGRDNVVHIGVAGHAGDQRAANRVRDALGRLMAFAQDDGRDTPGAVGAPDERARDDVNLD
jgi:predicted RNA-binding protein YlxR (DUF448 family)